MASMSNTRAERYDILRELKLNGEILSKEEWRYLMKTARLIKGRRTFAPTRVS
jgi:hypothetical protein